MRRMMLGKYFVQIVASVTVLVMFCVAGVSLSMYFSVGATVQKMQHENSQKLFSRIVRNIGTIDDTIYNLCINYYYANADARFLMFDANVEENIADGMLAMGRVKKTVISANPMIHSVYAFNAHTKRFYSSYKAFLYEDKGLEKLLLGLNPYPKLVPLYRLIDDTVPVLTYLMYDRMRDGVMNGGIAINISAGAFLNILWPGRTEDGGETVFLLAGDGLRIDGGGNAGVPEAVLSEIPDLYARGRAEKNGYLDTRVQGERTVVSFSYLEKHGILLISAQPYQEIARHFQTLRNTVATIAAGFLILMTILAFTVSRLVYRPVNTLVRHTGAGTEEKRNEISYLNALFDRNKAMLGRYETALHSYERTLKDFWFRRLLTGDATESESASLKRLEDYGFTKARAYAVCVLRIGKFATYEKSTTQEDLLLIKFAVVNVLMETLAEKFENYGASLEGDRAAIVLSAPRDGPFEHEAAALSRKGMAFIAEHFGVPLTVSISGRVEKAGEIATAYKDAASNSDYRFVYGADAVITPDKVTHNKANSALDFTFEGEKAVAEALRHGDPGAVEQALSAAVDTMSRLSYHNIVISMIHLTHMILDTVSNARKTAKRVETEQTLSDILRSISSIETAEEFKERLMRGLSPFLSGGDESGKFERHEALVRTILEYVEKNHGDPNLCLQRIAEVARLSSKHVNHIFKSVAGLSIPEHITGVRMKKAASMLETTSMSIKDIATAVGMVNQTYFYSMFKRKFGMSPKTYQLDFLMKQSKTEK